MMSGKSVKPGDVDMYTICHHFLDLEVPPCSVHPSIAPSSCGWVPIDVVVCVEKAVRSLHTENMPMGTQS
jgi:hypothetical protein